MELQSSAPATALPFAFRPTEHATGCVPPITTKGQIKPISNPLRFTCLPEIRAPPTPPPPNHPLTVC